MIKAKAGFLERRALSFIELIVAISIASMLFALIIRLYSHFSTRGVKQDRQTTCWTTYCRFSEALRADLAQAVQVSFPKDDRLIISVVNIDNDYKCNFKEVTWTLGDEQTIIRITPDDSKQIFSFAGGMAPEEKLTMKFSKTP